MSGFVYIWFDRKKKMFYIGSHWGSPDDGYICSSQWMHQAKKRRPNDFKRRILKTVTTSRQGLLVEEERWLQMIKPEEIKHRYYNLYLHTFNNAWYAHGHSRKTIGQKIADAQRGKKRGPRSEEDKKKISESKKKAFEQNPYERIIPHKSGWKQSDKWKEEASQRIKEQWENGTRKALSHQTPESNIKRSLTLKGRKPSETTVEAGRLAFSKTYMITPPTGEQFKVTNLKKFARENGLSDSNMIKSSSKGYKAIKVYCP